MQGAGAARACRAARREVVAAPGKAARAWHNVAQPGALTAV
jgi:hypothetical protein